MAATTINFKRVNSDVNGNPRYVCHFLNLLTDNEKINYNSNIDNYSIALKRAKQIDGRKFHNKQFGGGIVFQSSNIGETEQQIIELVKNAK